MMLDDIRDAQACNDDKGDGEAEKTDEGEFAFQANLRACDDWDWEGDEKDIGNDVGGTHGDELSVALSTLRAGIWHDLPVLMWC